MKILKQVGILFGLCWISMCIETMLPITFPASVIALAIVLILLIARVIQVDHIREKSDFLLGNMPFFFIPAAVGIIEYQELIRSTGLAFIVICTVSMVVTFAATAWSVQVTMRIIDRRRSKK